MTVDRGPETTTQPGAMLAGDADRERAIDVLKAGFAEGRLTKAEYDERVTRVHVARTYGDLAPLVTALDGQPATAVLAKLRQAGLHPRLAELPDGSQQPGSVITVAPAGPVPAGSTVTVTAAAAPPGRKHHHDHGGNRD